MQLQIVGLGYGRFGVPNDPQSVRESQQYLRDFSNVVATQETVEGIVTAMLGLHPSRDNPRVVWHCAREAVKKREHSVRYRTGFLEQEDSYDHGA